MTLAQPYKAGCQQSWSKEYYLADYRASPGSLFTSRPCECQHPTRRILLVEHLAERMTQRHSALLHDAWRAPRRGHDWHWRWASRWSGLLYVRSCSRSTSSPPYLSILLAAPDSPPVLRPIRRCSPSHSTILLPEPARPVMSCQRGAWVCQASRSSRSQSEAPDAALCRGVGTTILEACGCLFI